MIRGLEGSEEAEDFLLRPSGRIFPVEETFEIRRVNSEIYED